MDCKSMRAAAGRICLSTMLHVFLGSVSFLLLFLSLVHPTILKTNIQRPSDTPVQICSTQNTTARHQTKILQNPEHLGDNLLSYTKIKISMFSSLLPQVSFQHTFLFHSLSSTSLCRPATCPFLQQHRPLSTSCHWQSSPRVSTVKFT